MKDEVIQRLFAINSEFYQSFGAAFAETRRRVQPGVERILETVITNGDWVDLGCGSGALSQRWAKSGLSGSYLGLDFSDTLLDEALRNLKELPANPDLEINFRHADLADPNWTSLFDNKKYDGILAFASLHHIPGAFTRNRIIHQVVSLLKPGGLFIHSEWQFQRSPKLMTRVQPWSTAGLTEQDVEAGDTLLDWRHSAGGQTQGTGLRYVHIFTLEELKSLAENAGFEILETFDSDGASGNLSLYQVWKKL